MINLEETMESAMPSEEMYLFKAFSPMGWLSGVISDYQMREGQLRLASRVNKALRYGEDLVAEGPVGLGKSLAYSVPLAYRTVLSAATGLIVTANIALQEQLVFKDLPLLQKALPWQFDFSLIKGRNNYLCKNALRELYEKGPNGVTRLRMLDMQESTDAHMKIAAWADKTWTGDRSDLTFEPTPKVWSRFSVTAEECVGTPCPDYETCFANRARKLIAEGKHDIYVTNYHLFFGSLSHGESSISLPRFDFAIFDEAHQATDIARTFFGFKITEGSFRWISSRIPDQPALRRALESHTFELFRTLKAARESMGNSSYLRQPFLPDIYEPIVHQLKEAAAYFARRVVWHKELLNKPQGDETRKKLGRMQAADGHAQDACIRLAKRLQISMGNTDRGYVYSLETEKDQVILQAKRLRATDDGDERFKLHVDSRILVSATLTVGGSFDHIVEELKNTVPELGLSPVLRPFVAESPFHWTSQALLIIPEDFPSPKKREEFQKQSALAIGYSITQAKGRTLALFTSWTGLEAAYASLKDKTPYRLLKQGDMPRTKLLEEFRNDTSSVLFGVESFWSGVDIPGEALSCLIIDKLPFPNPDDPVMEALETSMRGSPFEGDIYQENDAFRRHSIPRMILSMRQGFGRLIRSTGDRGVVVVLDKRVHTKWDLYGKLLINSLPRVQLSTDLDDVGRFLTRA